MSNKSPRVIIPDAYSVTGSAVDEFIELLAHRQEELLAGIRAALRNELTVEKAHRLVADALTYSSIAAQLAVLAHTVAVERLKKG